MLPAETHTHVPALASSTVATGSHAATPVHAPDDASTGHAAIRAADHTDAEDGDQAHTATSINTEVPVTSSTAHAATPHPTPITSANRSRAAKSAPPLLALAAPVLFAVAGAAWLWLRGRSTATAPGKPATVKANKSTAQSRTTKTASKDLSPAKRTGQSGRKGSAASKASQQQAASEPQEPERHEPPSPPPEPIQPDTLDIVVVPLDLSPPPNPAPPLAPLPLLGQTFVVSEDMDVQGVPTSYGVKDWADHCTTASASALAVGRAVSAGAKGVSKVAVQTAGLDLVGPNYGCVANKTRICGGGATGAAVQVATGAANFALAIDTVGEVRNAAACANVYAYRPTPGPLGGAQLEAPSSAVSVASVVAADPALLMKVAQVLGAPGSSNIKGEILQFVVAQDLFDICAPELQPAILALKKAILKWAGSDQAGAVQLVKFLSAHLDSWRELLPGQELAGSYGFKDGESVRVHDFLEAALVAVDILRAEDLHSRAGAVARAAAAAKQPAAADPASSPETLTGPTVTPDTSAGSRPSPVSSQPTPTAQPTTPAEANTHQPATQEGTDEGSHVEKDAVQEQASASNDAAQEVQGSTSAPVEADPQPTATASVAATETDGSQAGAAGEQPADSTPTATATTEPPAPSLTDGILPPRPTPQQLAAARALAADVADCLKATVKPDVLMVLPALPFAPPKRNAEDPMEFVMFSKLTQAFNALATLGSCPTLTCPVGQLREGSPVAISIMSVHRYDQRLLAVAQRLCPMIHESFEAVKQEITQMAIQRAVEEQAQATKSAPASQQAAAGPSANGHAKAPQQAPTLPPRTRSSSGGGAAPAPSGAPPAAQAPAPAPPPVDPKKLDKAEKAKARGNELYQAGKYAEAMNEYTKAISLNPNSHVYLSNRAMTCIKLFRFEQAEEDCNNVLKFELSDKDKVKALLRRATARDALQKYDGAEQDLRAVLKLEPNNKQAREDLRALRQHQAQMAEAQAAMVHQMRMQQAAAGMAGNMLPPGAGLPPGMDPSMFPPGMDPSMFPPGMDPSMFPPGFFGPDGAPVEDYADFHQ